jgi:hypothetical protein
LTTIVLYFTIKTILSLGGIARGDGYSCTTLYHDITEIKKVTYYLSLEHITSEIKYGIKIRLWKPKWQLSVSVVDKTKSIILNFALFAIDATTNKLTEHRIHREIYK